MFRVARIGVSALLIVASILYAPTANAIPPVCTYSSTTSSGYKYVAFKVAGTTCTWDIPEAVTSADFLVVGGGGGGGVRHAGGGGAGGLLEPTSVSISNISSLQFYIGNGGAGGTSGLGAGGETTTVSKYSGSGTFTTLSAVGGGAGGGGGSLGLVGGSGGGSYSNGSFGTFTTGVAGTVGQGNAGGAGGYASNVWASGGGGGAGGVGGNGTSSIGGAGGAGTTWIASFTSSIASALGLTDTTTFFAGGGGGGITLGSGSANGGAGGAGGGGAGGGTGSFSTNGPSGAMGVAAIANTGGGGGGSGLQQGQANSNGGSGGSGIVLIRYSIPTASITSLTFSSPITKGTLETMTVTTNVSGKIRFFVNKKRVPGCLKVQTVNSGSGNTATCSWKPSVSGNLMAYATITPADVLISPVNSGSTLIPIARRSNTR